jgi:hypothetical protein
VKIVFFLHLIPLNARDYWWSLKKFTVNTPPPAGCLTVALLINSLMRAQTFAGGPLFDGRIFDGTYFDGK